MKILLTATLILIIVLAFFIADACSIAPRHYHNGSTALVLSVYDVPVIVYVANDPSAFVNGRAHHGYTPANWSGSGGMPTQ
jgi:hypothetical protein